MDKLLIMWIVFLSLLGNTAAQLSFSLQAALNEYCKNHPNHQGCHRRAPQNEFLGPEGCPVLSRRCPQKSDQCLPQDLPCSVLDSNERCSVPFTDGITVQTIYCGSGRLGDSCDSGGEVPMLSVIAIQCKPSPDIFRQPNSVDVLQVFKPGTGSDGGGGIYRCLPGNQWASIYENSPFLSDLIHSCYYAGCGLLPSPRGDRAPSQHWPWVRGLLDAQDRLLCTATLVSHDAMITAAHCVTRTLTSTVPVDRRQRRVSVPLDSVVQISSVSSIYIHPNYVAGDIRENDIAVVKFAGVPGVSRPHACLPTPQSIDRNPPGVIFKYDNFFTNWTTAYSRYSESCRSSQAFTCSVRANPGQFCALQSSVQLEPKSSGGPYLVNMAPGSLDYRWAVEGVYSREHRASSSCNPNYVYVSTRQHVDWLQQCVINGFCRT